VANSILWNQGSEIAALSGNPTVIYSCLQGGYPGIGNISASPLFLDPSQGDYRLQDTSPCIDRGTNIGLPFNGAAPDLGAWESPAEYSPGPIFPPRVWYVRGSNLPGGDGQSWTTAFKRVAEALDVCTASDEIWVAEGAYKESIIMEPRVSLYGAFVGNETSRLNRDVEQHATNLVSANSYRPVVTARYVEGFNIDGFTLRNGNRGIDCSHVEIAHVTRCSIYGNEVYGGPARG
jgi:hypothetical protein